MVHFLSESMGGAGAEEPSMSRVRWSFMGKILPRTTTLGRRR